jgi:hypothetical protein
MLNYLKKFALDVVPSVVATILGAYIVNHYISAKSSPDHPPAAVASTTEAGKKSEPKKAQVKPAETAAEVTSAPEPGVKAKGISERAMIENRAAERPAEVKPVEVRPTDIAKPAETASISAEPKGEIKRPQPAPREKAVAKIAPAQTAAPTPTTAPATEAASASDEPRDANELALEAIKRLRANGEGAPRVQETSRQAEPPRVQESPRTAAVVPGVTAPAPVRPLPPPIVVATPSPTDNGAQGPGPTAPPYTASIDPNRPTPPADIPPRPPVDLKTEANNAVSHTKNVAEDMLAAAKSVFHAVLPGTDKQSSSPSQFTD